MASYLFFSADFGLRSPAIQKQIQTKRATSIIARVSLREISRALKGAHGRSWVLSTSIFRGRSGAFTKRAEPEK